MSPPLPPSSHSPRQKPSPLLALVALGVAHRFEPAWLAVDLADVAAPLAVAPQRLSRLVSRAIAVFDDALAALVRRGRPPHDDARAALESELALTRALLQIASTILDRVPLRRFASLIVGAWLRLKLEHPSISQPRFCAALSLPPRTLRFWLRRTPAPAAPPVPPPAEPPRKRPPRRPRFGFGLTLPDTQIGSDTTNISAFDVALKLVAAQDIGGRDADLFDSILVDDRESAEHVVRVLSATLQPGAQAITDQGTPYMAQTTRDAIEELQAEHAPQREATPTAKATVERAFLSLKSIAHPLLDLTNRIARSVPALRRPDLAKATATLLLTALLRAYQAGARATRRSIEARGNLDPTTLAQLAAKSRDDARVLDQSSKLFLRFLHSSYQLSGSRDAFVASLRHIPPEVLKDAEREFHGQAHRPDIRHSGRYFAAIARRLHDHYRRKARRQADNLAFLRDLDRQRRDHQQRLARWLAHPATWVYDALAAIATYWHDGRLLFDGVGPGTGWLHAALDRLRETLGPEAAIDAARGSFRAFCAHNPLALPSQGLQAIGAVLDRRLQAISTLAPRASSAMLDSAGLPRRPPPPHHLRI